MIEKIIEISTNNPIFLHPLDGVLKVKNIALKKNQYYFPVIEDNKLVGVLTHKHLMVAHPNRIVADVMSSQFSTISYDDFIWNAKEKFVNTDVEALFVKENDEIAGILTESQVDIALSKHIDALTGLYKSNYIYYLSNKLIHQSKEISFIFLDINKFGLIDKDHGHIIGDNILQELSSLLLKEMPEDTYLCRYAGDEFLILTSYFLDDCILLAEKLIHAVSNYTFTNGLKITLAAGISGGRRLLERPRNINTTIVRDLINLASLASTKAKIQKCNFIVADKLTTYEIEEMIS